MANINITVDSHTCTPPELLSVSTGFSGGTSDVTFQITWDSIGSIYQQYFDPNTRLLLQYNYQDGAGWRDYTPDLPFQSLTDYPITIERRFGFDTVQFRLTLITDTECGTMYSNILSNIYT